VGQGRNLALIRSSLDVVKTIAYANDAKVNDVLLTVIAGGLRKLLAHRGEVVNGIELCVYVPVSLRRGIYAGARGNAIAQMVIPLLLVLKTLRLGRS
jgi:diacylglycerol O-acyltransferase